MKGRKRGRPLKKENVKKGASLPGQMANKMKVPKLGVGAKQKMNQMQKIQTETDLKFLLKSPTSRRGRGRMGRKRKETSQ